VLGAMGVYRAAFTSIAQTEPLTRSKILVPTVALAGSKQGLGEKVGEMVKLVAARVEAHTLSDSGHFVPEEQPDVIVKHILAMVARSS
jgi:pimeloyl-ACP methyl ester carboxylesterase